MSGKKKKPKFDDSKFKVDGERRGDVKHIRELNAYLNHCKDKMAFSPPKEEEKIQIDLDMYNSFKGKL